MQWNVFVFENEKDSRYQVQLYIEKVFVKKACCTCELSKCSFHLLKVETLHCFYHVIFFNV